MGATCTHADVARACLMDPAGSWGTLGTHVAAVKGELWRLAIEIGHMILSYLTSDKIKIVGFHDATRHATILS